MWLGHDPALVLHDILGTGWANWVMAAVYLVWIGLVPATLAIALVWTRRSTAGAWYVTATSLNWCLGAAALLRRAVAGPDVLLPRVVRGPGPHPEHVGARHAALGPRRGARRAVGHHHRADDRRLRLAARGGHGDDLPVQRADAAAPRGAGRELDLPRPDDRGDGLPRLALLRRRPRRDRRRVRVGGPRRPRHGQPAAATRGGVDPAAGAGRRGEPRRLGLREGVAQALGVRRLLAVGVLRAGPEEAAQPVALGARDDVEVQVRHRLADRVVDRDEGSLRAEAVLDRGRDPLRGGEEAVAQPGRQVREGLDVLARDEQDVALEDRPGVEEGDEVVGLEDEVAGQVAGHDPAEDAVSHADSVPVRPGAPGQVGHRWRCRAPRRCRPVSRWPPPCRPGRRRRDRGR